MFQVGSGVSWNEPSQRPSRRSHQPRASSASTRTRRTHSRRADRADDANANLHTAAPPSRRRRHAANKRRRTAAAATSATARDFNYIQRARMEYLKHSPYAEAAWTHSPVLQRANNPRHPRRPDQQRGRGGRRGQGVHSVRARRVAQRPQSAVIRRRGGESMRGVSSGHDGRQRQNGSALSETTSNGSRATDRQNGAASPPHRVPHGVGLLPRGVGPELLMLTSFVVQSDERLQEYVVTVCRCHAIGVALCPVL